MTFVIQICIAPTRRWPPLTPLPVRLETSSAKDPRLVSMTTLAKPIDDHLDQRVSRVIRRGLVTSNATRSRDSRIGVINRLVNNRELGRSAYTTTATTTATAGGSLFSPAAERRPEFSPSVLPEVTRPAKHAHGRRRVRRPAPHGSAAVHSATPEPDAPAPLLERSIKTRFVGTFCQGGTTPRPRSALAAAGFIDARPPELESATHSASSAPPDIDTLPGERLATPSRILFVTRSPPDSVDPLCKRLHQQIQEHG